MYILRTIYIVLYIALAQGFELEPVRAEPLREAALCGKSVLFASRNRALGGGPGALLVLGAGRRPNARRGARRGGAAAGSRVHPMAELLRT